MATLGFFYTFTFDKNFYFLNKQNEKNSTFYFNTKFY